jgi:ParB family chromosome partitioning protein
MLKNIKLRNIKPNPFNARSDYEDEPIKELAKEIKESGFWASALRGRAVNGQVELCFGHRRLAALKKLGYQEVQVDVVDLTDNEMAMQGLAENLQRQGLNDMDKAEGIKHLVQQLAATQGWSKEKILEKVAVMLGVSVGWIEQLIGITYYNNSAKKLIAEKKIAAKTAIVAHGLGGDEMIKTAAEKHLPLHTLTKINQSLKKIPDEKIKEKIKQQVISGKISTPEDVEKKAEPLLHAKAKKNEPPPDLMIVISHWTIAIKDWRKALREVIPYRAYFNKTPKIAAEFVEQVRGLIEELEKFLPREIE